jgi:hypothetical protein
VEFISNNDTKIDENGNWAMVVPMNINPVVTDEFGNLIPSEDPNNWYTNRSQGEI